jgi:hypothetical protein
VYLERTKNAWRKHLLCLLVYGSAWKAPFMFRNDNESLESTCCVHWLMAVLGKHSLCLKMIVNPWKTLVVLPS